MIRPSQPGRFIAELMFDSALDGALLPECHSNSLEQGNGPSEFQSFVFTESPHGGVQIDSISSPSSQTRGPSLLVCEDVMRCTIERSIKSFFIWTIGDLTRIWPIRFHGFEDIDMNNDSASKNARYRSAIDCRSAWVFVD